MAQAVQQLDNATNIIDRLSRNEMPAAVPRSFDRRPQRIAVLALLSVLSLSTSVGRLAAQVNDSRDDGAEAFYDAILGTPNLYTPQPQDNVFATAYGLEQQAPRSQFTFNGLLPLLVNSNPLVLSSGGTSSGEFSPLAGITWTTPVSSLPLRFSANVRAEVDRFMSESSADFDKIAASARLQYVDPNNDQAFSPYIVYAPRWDFAPTFASEFSGRQDVNVGFNKTFNFDASSQRVAISGSSSADTQWSFGLTAQVQRRFREPLASSWGFFVIPSVSYVISPQWNLSGGVEILYRDFDSSNGLDQNDWFIEPIAVLEFVIPETGFGSASNATIFGRPALDFMVAYEKNWSNFDPADYSLWRVGVVLKLGWRT